MQDRQATIERVVEARASGATLRQAAAAAGVRGATLCRWQARDPGLAETLDPSRPFVRLRYSIARRDTKEQDALDSPVRLTTTLPRFGGQRWWFVCPLVVTGRPCDRRVGKLYLPPGGRYFGCRHCYRLTYRSCQDSRKPDSLLRDLAARMGTDAATLRRPTQP